MWPAKPKELPTPDVESGERERERAKDVPIFFFWQELKKITVKRFYFYPIFCSSSFNKGTYVEYYWLWLFTIYYFALKNKPSLVPLLD